MMHTCLTGYEQPAAFYENKKPAGKAGLYAANRGLFNNNGIAVCA